MAESESGQRRMGGRPATEAATMIARIDDVIAAEQATELATTSAVESIVVARFRSRVSALPSRFSVRDRHDRYRVLDVRFA